MSTKVRTLVPNNNTYCLKQTRPTELSGQHLALCQCIVAYHFCASFTLIRSKLEAFHGANTCLNDYEVCLSYEQITCLNDNEVCLSHVQITQCNFFWLACTKSPELSQRERKNTLTLLLPLIAIPGTISVLLLISTKSLFFFLLFSLECKVPMLTLTKPGLDERGIPPQPPQKREKNSPKL